MGRRCRGRVSHSFGLGPGAGGFRSLVAEITALRAEFLAEGVNHIVLCGMGGSSLAPEVITATAGVELTVLDSTEPGQVRAAVSDRLASTAIVVSSSPAPPWKPTPSGAFSSRSSRRPGSMPSPAL